MSEGIRAWLTLWSRYVPVVVNLSNFASLFLTLSLDQALNASNFLLSDYERKRKQGLTAARRGVGLKKKMEEEKEKAATTSKRCEELEKEAGDLRKETRDLKKELAGVKRELEAVHVEKESIQSWAEAERERLRISRATWVRLEQRKVKGALVAKNAARLKKIRKHICDQKELHKVALMISQIKGTNKCLKVLRDKSGVAFPDEEFKRLERDLAAWEAKYGKVEIDESFVNTDLEVDPEDEAPSPMSDSAETANSEESLRSDMLGSDTKNATLAATVVSRSSPRIIEGYRIFCSKCARSPGRV